MTPDVFPAPEAESVPLRLQVLGSSFAVVDVPDGVRVRLSEMMRPFVLPDDVGIDDAPVVRFSSAWDDRFGVWQVLQDGEQLMGVPDEDALLLQLEWRAIAAGLQQVEGCGVFHAGVLTRGAATVLLLGESGAGKTTLTLGLIARGWLPVADDVAIVDVETLGLRVFQRCFHVEHESQRPAGARPPLESIVGVEGHARPLRWAEEGRRPTAIVTIARDPAAPSRLTPMLRAEAAAALFRGALATRLTRPEIASLSARIAVTARYCGHLNNGDLTVALDLLEAACVGGLLP
jgi:hypothetical protein